MKPPLRAGPLLPEPQWRRICRETIFRHCKWDMQVGDHCALAAFPLLLEHKEWERLAKWAERLTAEALAAEQELLSRPELLDHLGLPGRIKKVLRDAHRRSIDGKAPRVMRFDFHWTNGGWRISEVNSDVPGGYIEASGFTELMAEHYTSTAAPPNPTQAYARALMRRAGSANGLIALVYATAYSDDGQVMEYIARELRARGLRTCLLSPAHLLWESGRARIVCQFAQGFPDVIVRFFPAEWLPNLRSPEKWRGYFDGAGTAVSNPGTSLVTQSKRFPLTWDDLSVSLPTWRELLPATVRVRSANDLQSGRWVLKPALGRVGEGVAIARVSSDSEWHSAKWEACLHPSLWVAQLRFDVVPLEVTGKLYYPCLGIYTVEGQACGIYGRVAEKSLIDADAQDIAVLITEDEMNA